jgi:hypothetical protein
MEAVYMCYREVTPGPVAYDVIPYLLMDWDQVRTK